MRCQGEWLKLLKGLECYDYEKRQNNYNYLTRRRKKERIVINLKDVHMMTGSNYLSCW